MNLLALVTLGRRRLRSGVRAGKSQGVSTHGFGGALLKAGAYSRQDALGDFSIVGRQDSGRNFFLKLQQIYRKPALIVLNTFSHLAALGNSISLAQPSMSQTKEEIF